MEDSARLGWVKLHRKLLDNPRFSDGDWLKVWSACLLKATHKPYAVIFGGQKITLQPGQFITSQKTLSTLAKVQGSKVERILRTLKTDNQIDILGSNRNRLITVKNWIQYQGDDKPNEKPVTTHRQTSDNEQELKELKEPSITSGKASDKGALEGGQAPDPVTSIIAHLNKKTGQSFRSQTESTRTLIAARLKDGFTPEDCLRVIDIKAASWMGDPKMEKFLRPSTLFKASKFEGYAQEKPSNAAQAPRNGRPSADAVQASQATLLAMAQEAPFAAA